MPQERSADVSSLAIQKLKQQLEKKKQEEQKKFVETKFSIIEHRAAQGDRKAKKLLKEIAEKKERAQRDEQLMLQNHQDKRDQHNCLDGIRRKTPQQNLPAKHERNVLPIKPPSFDELMRIARENQQRASNGLPPKDTRQPSTRNAQNLAIKTKKPVTPTSSQTAISNNCGSMQSNNHRSSEAKHKSHTPKTQRVTEHKVHTPSRAKPVSNQHKPVSSQHKPVSSQHKPMPSQHKKQLVETKPRSAYVIGKPQNHRSKPLPPMKEKSPPNRPNSHKAPSRYHNNYDEDDEEDDEYESDFVVDEEEEEERSAISSAISRMFRYDKALCDRREALIESEGDRMYRQIGKVKSFEDLEREERRSAKLAAMEDREAERLEEERKSRKRKLKAQRRH